MPDWNKMNVIQDKTSDITTRLNKRFGIGIEHKSTKSLQAILRNPKDEMTKKEKPEHHLQTKLFRTVKNTTSD